MADQKISQLPAGGTIDGDELVPLVQDGATVTKTVTQIQAFIVDPDTATLDTAQDWSARQTFLDGVHIDGPTASDVAQLVWEREGLHRWSLFRNNTAEAGADAGSNLDLYSYDDAGSIKSLIFRVTRSTGVLNFNIQPTIGGSNILKASDIGSTVQAYDADLASIAALTTQSFGRDFLTYANEAAFKAAVNLEANTDFYAPGGTDVAVADGGTGASTARAAAANLQLLRVIGHSGVAAVLTGTTSETTMATIPIAAGELGPNGCIEVEVVWIVTNNANAKTIRVRLGSSGAGLSGTVYDTATPTSTAGQRRASRISNRNSASSQVSGGSTASGGFGSIGSVTTGTINTANATDLVITGQLTNTGDTATLESYIVKLYYGA